eukprot:TRINITY_DN8_c0_g1_i6.p1 TRINITY_DN8_c0_g1~~TRINITY_DN8_c0_g1_i6.p1  ORF type:complete len:520 (-),score=95.90 TRINITY_DN8_c0_g1_i6:137-1696(-)
MRTSKVTQNVTPKATGSMSGSWSVSVMPNQTLKPKASPKETPKEILTQTTSQWAMPKSTLMRTASPSAKLMQTQTATASQSAKTQTPTATRWPYAMRTQTRTTTATPSANADADADGDKVAVRDADADADHDRDAVREADADADGDSVTVRDADADADRGASGEDGSARWRRHRRDEDPADELGGEDPAAVDRSRGRYSARRHGGHRSSGDGGSSHRRHDYDPVDDEDDSRPRRDPHDARRPGRRDGMDNEDPLDLLGRGLTPVVAAKIFRDPSLSRQAGVLPNTSPEALAERLPVVIANAVSASDRGTGTSGDAAHGALSGGATAAAPRPGMGSSRIGGGNARAPVAPNVKQPAAQRSAASRVLFLDDVARSGLPDVARGAYTGRHAGCPPRHDDTTWAMRQPDAEPSGWCGGGDCVFSDAWHGFCSTGFGHRMPHALRGDDCVMYPRIPPALRHEIKLIHLLDMNMYPQFFTGHPKDRAFSYHPAGSALTRKIELLVEAMAARGVVPHVDALPDTCA